MPFLLAYLFIYGCRGAFKIKISHRLGYVLGEIMQDKGDQNKFVWPQHVHVMRYL